MEYNRLKNMLNLMKPFLPTDVTSLFEEFIEEYVQLLEINKYNYGIIKELGEDKDKLRQKLVQKNQQVEELNKLVAELQNDLFRYSQIEYERQKEQDEMVKRIEFLTKEVKRLQEEEEELRQQRETLENQVRRLKGKNTFLRILHQRAIREIELSIPKEEHESKVASLKKELLEIKHELECAKQEIAMLLAEKEKLKEKMYYHYTNGYKQGMYEHRRRKKILKSR
jgi:chromosome segregation ATPase